MIQQLRKKFIYTAMLCVSILIFVMLGALNFLNIHTIYDEIKKDLVLLSESVDKTLSDFDVQNSEITFGEFLEKPKSNQDLIVSSNYFVVRFDQNGDPVYVNTSRTPSISNKKAIQLASKVRTPKYFFGKYSKYQVHITTTDDIETIVFLDVSDEIVSYLRVLLLSCAIGLICWGIMLTIVIFLSDKAIKPVVESIEKQKQFITDAGHELKTPIAVIRSNVDALELYTGQTKWSGNIKNQTLHLTDLVQNLLTLSKMDEDTLYNITEVSASVLMQEVLDAFQTAANEKELQLHSELEPDIKIRGDRGQLKNLFTILIDNAISYSNDHGQIDVFLSLKNHHFLLVIENTCNAVPDAPPEKLFERFFRADRSRNQSSGKHGIGLSIAKAIVSSHKGTIDTEYLSEQKIRFTVKL